MRMHAELCPTLCGPMDCSLSGSSVHGILQARILRSFAISFSRGSSPPRDQTSISYASFIGTQVLYHYGHFRSPVPSQMIRWLFLKAYFSQWKELLMHKNWHVITVHLPVLWRLSPSKVKSSKWWCWFWSQHLMRRWVCVRRMVQDKCWATYTEILAPDIFKSKSPL